MGSVVDYKDHGQSMAAISIRGIVYEETVWSLFLIRGSLPRYHFPFKPDFIPLPLQSCHYLTIFTLFAASYFLEL